MRFAGLALSALALAPGGIVLAQQGDRENDPQPDVPAHILAPPAPPLAPEEAMRTFSIEPGFRIELVASEPLVADPIAIMFGPDGRLWVVEMRGYMRDVEATDEDAPVGVIAVLSDTDIDGRMDTRTEFARGLVLPRALALAGDGVLVGEPPHLWWLRDTDGDGAADTREEIASDYGAPGNPEHTANGLYRALDNWIYNANHRTRFRHRGGATFERDPTIGRGQWGLAQDDTGRLYYNSNSLPLQVDLVPAEYLARNPELGDPTTPGRIIAGLHDIRVWPTRVTPGVNRGYKILDDTGRITEVTAACAPLIYRSGRFPPEYRGNAFFCEPAGHLLKRLVIEPTPDGGLVARNAAEGREFLASTDERFRPVNLADGPDGALYVVDMYRGVIQHRNFVTTFLRRQIEARALETPLGMGRIYRIVPDDAPAAGVRPALQESTPAEQVAALRSPQSWWRDTAQRLLVERGAPEVVEPLRRLTRTGSPLARLHALWTLEGIGQIDPSTVHAALADADARVRAAGVRLAEPALRAGDARVLAAVLALAGTSDPDLRRQLALSLAESAEALAWSARVRLAREHGGTAGLDDALVSGLRGREAAFLAELAAQPADAALPVAEQLVATIVRRGVAAEQDPLFGTAEVATLASAFLRQAVIGGLERLARIHGAPADANGRRVALAVEPAAVRAWARDQDALGERAGRLLRWLEAPSDREAAAQVAVRPLTPEERERFRQGEAAFAVCAGCHHPEGVGYTGVAPSLVDSRWVSGPEEALVRIVLHGKEGDSFGMPPLGALDDQTIAAITTYIRRAWRQQADPVSPVTVAEIRAAEAGRERPWSAEELERLVRERSSAP